jgi:hypothetical protein
MEGQVKELDFKGRVREEEMQLNNSIWNLQEFIENTDTYDKLSSWEQNDLVKQIVVMQEYSDILGRRIRRFDY